ncbi:MAG TPA: glycosyltransferase family 39 protein [Ktedonobacterales bacterium]|nr:glycosyltransferase family 39 protein [Ktedonobacterales bacterium]
MAQTTSAPRRMTMLSQPVLWLRRTPWEIRWLFIICVVALAMRALPLHGLSTEYDEGVYWQSLRAMANGQPLFTGVFSSQPPLFLLGLYPLYLLFGQSLIAARLAVALYSLAGIVAMYFAGRRLAGNWVGLIAALLLAVDPLYVTESHTLQAEAPAIAFEVVAVAFALSALGALGRRRLWLAACAGIALGLGVMVKLFDIVALIPVLAYLAQPIFATARNGRGGPRRPSRAELIVGLRRSAPACAVCVAGMLAAILVVALPFVGNWGAAYDQVVRFHLVAGRTATGSLRGNVSAILHVRGEYPLWLAAAGGVFLAMLTRRWICAPILLWLLASFALLAQQQPLFQHHIALLVPPLVLLAGLTPTAFVGARVGARAHEANALFQWASRLALALALFASVAGVFISVKNDSRAAQAVPFNTLRIASMVAAITIPTDYVVTDDQYIAGLADRNVPPQLVDTSLVRIQAGYLTAAQLERIVTATDSRTILFASGRFDQITGFRAWVEAHFTAVPQVGDGHMLYVKAPQTPTPV